ncbi:MAG: hypothetical protein JSV70_03680 [bacterium]|nr:MAG: hypothetical protein JSV70_03680 [bacterium]
MAFLLALFFTVVMTPVPGPSFGDSLLPDGCLGNLTDNQIVVYYFHRKFRCQSCDILEFTLQKTLQVTYSDQFIAGKLAMCVINVDQPENRHYLEQFQILSNSVVIVRKRSGVVARYKTLESIWDVSQDREAIDSLLRTEVAAFLSES